MCIYKYICIYVLNGLSLSLLLLLLSSALLLVYDYHYYMIFRRELAPASGLIGHTPTDGIGTPDPNPRNLVNRCL